MKKILYILTLLLIFCFIENINAFNTNLKVYDYAQILTEEEEYNLKKDIDLFIANNNIDMVLITVKHHEFKTTKEYADKFYNTHGFGIGQLKSGIVGVVDLGINTITVTKYGTALENFPDDITKKISNKVNNKYKKGYYKMLDTFVGETYDYSYSKNNTFLNLGYNVIKILKLITISFIISIIFSTILILKSKNKTQKNIVVKDYIVKDSLEINKKQEKFITTQTKTNKIITKKKGFTLIELLAVIVILAIIALIATPIVLNIINETKESASIRSAEMYLDAVEQSIAKAQLNNDTINSDTYNIIENGIIYV